LNHHEGQHSRTNANEADFASMGLAKLMLVDAKIDAKTWAQKVFLSGLYRPALVWLRKH